ncbi:MAG: hypothetical protein IIZ53_03120 [Ruminococcus sp.]|nr:hypothetical protein [Ruminococcus sp.]
MSTAMTSREAFPVTMGDLTVFCESFKASAVKAINEENTVNGKSLMTSSAVRSLRLVFSGRIYDMSSSVGILVDLGGAMTSDRTYTVIYRGVRFSGCIMQKYELTDSGNDWYDVSFTLITFDEAEVSEE